jgi:hypothetical protein
VSDPRAGFLSGSSSSDPPTAPFGCGGVSFGICFKRVVMRSGQPSRNSGSSTATLSLPTSSSAAENSVSA